MNTTTPNSAIRTSVRLRIVRLARCDCSARDSFGSCFFRLRGMILRAMLLPFCQIVPIVWMASTVKTGTVYNLSLIHICSTFKLVTLAAALDCGAVTENSTFYCGGHETFNDREQEVS